MSAISYFKICAWMNSSIYRSVNFNGNFKGQVLCKVEYKELANCALCVQYCSAWSKVGQAKCMVVYLIVNSAIFLTDSWFFPLVKGCLCTSISRLGTVFQTSKDSSWKGLAVGPLQISHGGHGTFSGCLESFSQLASAGAQTLSQKGKLLH
jgi:hypothetical protein